MIQSGKFKASEINQMKLMIRTNCLTMIKIKQITKEMEFNVTVRRWDDNNSK